MSWDQFGQVKAEIRAEHPVAIGFQWPKGDEQYRKLIDGLMSVPPREGMLDGHSIIMVGYQDDPKAPRGASSCSEILIVPRMGRMATEKCRMNTSAAMPMMVFRCASAVCRRPQKSGSRAVKCLDNQ